MTDPPPAPAPEKTPLATDPRPRQLLEKYTSLVGALLMDTGESLLEFEVPEGERAPWGGAARVRIALAPEALDEDPEAELLALGSPLFERLVGAIRSRGVRELRGLIPPTVNPAVERIDLPLPLVGTTAEPGEVELAVLPIGRLLARVSIKAGPRLEERLVESALVDLSTGVPVPEDLVRAEPATAGTPAANAREAAPRPAAELMPLLVGHIERVLQADIARAEDEAGRTLKAEVERLERYYGAVLAELGSEDDREDAEDAKAAIRGELERRREEETERHRVRVTVHPLQIVEWRVLAQRARWRLRSDSGREATLEATRLLCGAARWAIHCPGCGAEPAAIAVCRGGHACCPACSERCAICAEPSCRAHGLARCDAGKHPVCAEHARTCGSCGKGHCVEHAAECEAGRHRVCPACAIGCGRCGLAICRAHATRTGELAPKGARWLCAGCVTLCEGGTSEPVGLDEVVRCGSCERHVCQRHQATCAVDGAVHCSRHLRRSDASGRLLCEAHRDTCVEEPGAVLATDEVAACATCGARVCEKHGGACESEVFKPRHCARHLVGLADRGGAMACERHRTMCHVDGAAFSLEGTKACAVCGKATCEGHRRACPWCGRPVCTRDIEAQRCVTCGKLAETADPADELVQAAIAANGGEPPKAKAWKTARDASGTVVELDLGWTRRLVFGVPHGEAAPATVVQHSMLGSKPVR
ncbi:MAG TPA: hypothetical protein VFU46_02785 [Gemmatimonadales bacterium]|nr:hypothetical protein [Gemmatimonadales bacterium]